MKIKVLATPNSKIVRVIPLDKAIYKVNIDAPSREGKANRRLIEILAEYFNVSKSNVIIKSGLGASNKIVEIKK